MGERDNRLLHKLDKFLRITETNVKGELASIKYSQAVARLLQFKPRAGRLLIENKRYTALRVPASSKDINIWEINNELIKEDQIGLLASPRLNENNVYYYSPDWIIKNVSDDLYLLNANDKIIITDSSHSVYLCSGDEEKRGIFYTIHEGVVNQWTEDLASDVQVGLLGNS